MKKLILLLAILTMGVVSAQNSLGMSLGYSLNNAFTFDIAIPHGAQRYHIGFSSELGTGIYPEKRNAGTSNFGLSGQGYGEQFWTIDLGYSRSYKNITLQPEVSLGQNRFFQNYSDRRFTEGGYSDIVGTESLFGYGGNLGYTFKSKKPYGVGWEPFIGYNTIKGAAIGVRMLF